MYVQEDIFFHINYESSYLQSNIYFSFSKQNKMLLDINYESSFLRQALLLVSITNSRTSYYLLAFWQMFCGEIVLFTYDAGLVPERCR